MDMREGTSEATAYYRSGRFFRVNQKYFFQCRDEADQGPYPDLESANTILSKYLATKARHKKQVMKNTCKPAIAEIHETVFREYESAFEDVQTIAEEAITAVKPGVSHQIELTPVLVDEYVLGAIIGNVSVIDEDSANPFIYSVNDKRFEVLGHTLKLINSEFFDCAADSPVEVTIFAKNDKNRHCQKTISIDIQSLG